MPKAFEDCIKNGGKVVTKKLKDDKYINICYDKKGNSYPGEVKKKKKESSIIDRAKEVLRGLKELI